MNLRDFFYPERAMAFAFKLCCVLLCLLALPEFLAALLPQLSGTQLFGLLVLCVLASPLAYVIRERRHRRVVRAPRRGAERTPLPPPNEEEG